MSYPTMDLDVDDDGVARLTLTQADRGNPIADDFCRDICDVSIELSERSDVRAVLLSAEGKAFGTGGDIKAFVEAGDKLPRLIKRWTADLHMGIARLQRMDAPIVAAVQGACAGGSVALAAGCDFVLASPDARFVGAYTAIGYSPDAGSTVAVSRRIGLQAARRFFLLNEPLDGVAAVEAGLADELVEPDELLKRAAAIATRLAQGATQALGETRRLLLSAAVTPLETQLENEAQALTRAAGRAEAREGLQAFVEKRRPDFAGALPVSR